MVKNVYVLINPFGMARIRARRPVVIDPGMTLVVLRCRGAPGATKQIEIDLADLAEVEEGE
jgi:hypothetical protein